MERYKNEGEYFDNCDFSYKLDEFVNNISENNRWWFKECNANSDGVYFVTYKSYEIQEYSKFVLSIRVDKIDDHYKFTIINQITDLV